MASTNINVRTETELKNKAEKIFEDLGLNMSVAINMFLKQTVRENGIPFSLKLEIPNEDTKAALAEYEEMKHDKTKYPQFDSFDEILLEVAEDAEDYKIK